MEGMWCIHTNSYSFRILGRNTLVTHRRNEMYLQRGLPLVIAQFYLMLQHINMVKIDSRPQNNKKIKLKRILSSYSSALLAKKTKKS